MDEPVRDLYNIPSETMSEKDLEESIDTLVEVFRKVETKDRKYHFKTFKKCFIGTEAVDNIIDSGHAQSREDAVLIGQALQEDHSLFEHVTRDHKFSDEYLFYHFIDEKKLGRRGVNEITGKASTWADFLNVSTSTTGNKQITYLPRLPLPDFDVVPPKDQHVASTIWPLDEHNATLLDRVHPTNWEDPVPHHSKNEKKSGAENTYDLIVIGAGAGGLVTSAGSAGLGARVALIESNLLGGDCLNVGCVPSKALIHSANLAHGAKCTRQLEESGITIEGGANAVKVNFPKVMERMRRIRSDISTNDSAERFTKQLGVEVFFGHGKFSSDRTVVVNGRTLEFRKAVIATGGYPALISMTGLKFLYEKANSTEVGAVRPIVMTNETLFNMTTQPKKLCVIGAGVVGMEMSQAMQRLGSEVVVFGRSGRVLPKEDLDLSNIVKNQIEEDGVTFRLSVKEYVSINMTGKVLDNGLPELCMTIQELVGGKVVKSEVLMDALLVAVGRKPNVTGMDLEKAGIEFDSRKGLVVNDRLLTTNPRVFGVGDCCSAFKFTHAADFMARMVIRNALFFGSAKMSDLIIPYSTFTTPEVGSVGLYESDLKERGIAYKTFEKHFSENDRAICDDSTSGMVRIRVDAKSDKILGASIVGIGAGNMISEITLAMQTGTGLGKLSAVIHPYPTTADAVRATGDLYNKTRATPAVRGILRGLIQMQRYGS